MIKSFDNLSELQENAGQIYQSTLSRTEQAQQDYESINTSIVEAQTNSNDVKKDLDSLLDEKTKLVDSVGVLQKELESLHRTQADRSNSIAQIEDQIEVKTLERKALNQDVSAAEAELSHLKSDIHLFPSEISGYVKQGARNIWLYLAICAVPFVVIVAVTNKLFTNSENLLKLFFDNPNVPIVDYLISRLPYAVVSLAILTVCYTIVHRLFAEIISINRRKQDLFKISIIATDVSFASQQGLLLSEEQSYNLRTETKMEMLKEHLRQHISEDYVYGSSGSILQKVMEAAKSRLEKIEESDDHKK